MLAEYAGWKPAARPAGCRRSERLTVLQSLCEPLEPPSVVLHRLSSHALEADGAIIDPASFVGNVYGVLRDGMTGEPLAKAQVGLLPLTLEETNGDLSLRCGTPSSAAFDCIQQWIHSRAVRSEATASNGSFLINMVPTPGDGRDYTMVLSDARHQTALVQVHVLPGACMALEVTAGLILTGAAESEQSDLDLHYRHESTENRDATAGFIASRSVHPEIFRGLIFATREGLVGGTTANGHIIVPNDRFVALPSRRALSSNFGHEREVRLTYRGRTTVAPVWDVGPWNTHDDYWNPPDIRETFKDLPMGKPEAEAAFSDRYNNGLDERGRVVKNPAGIDLADGTFLLDLGLTNNDRVAVEYLWVDNSGPLLSSLTVSPDPVVGGGTLLLEATASDVTTGNAPIAGVEFFFDTLDQPGSGTATLPADGAFDSPTEVARATITVTLTSGQRHTVFFRARDVYGNWGAVVQTSFSVLKAPRQRAVGR